MLISYAPARLEDYFFEVGQPFEGELPPKPTEAEIDKLLEAAPKYGIEFVFPAEGSSSQILTGHDVRRTPLLNLMNPCIVDFLF